MLVTGRQNHFVSAVTGWIMEVGGPSPDIDDMFGAIRRSLTLFETRWEKDSRVRVNEFECKVRRRARTAGVFNEGAPAEDE